MWELLFGDFVGQDHRRRSMEKGLKWCGKNLMSSKNCKTWCSVDTKDFFGTPPTQTNPLPSCSSRSRSWVNKAIVIQCDDFFRKQTNIWTMNNACKIITTPEELGQPKKLIYHPMHTFACWSIIKFNLNFCTRMPGDILGQKLVRIPNAQASSIIHSGWCVTIRYLLWPVFRVFDCAAVECVGIMTEKENREKYGKPARCTQNLNVYLLSMAPYIIAVPTSTPDNEDELLRLKKKRSTGQTNFPSFQNQSFGYNMVTQYK